MCWRSVFRLGLSKGPARSSSPTRRGRSSRWFGSMGGPWGTAGRGRSRLISWRGTASLSGGSAAMVDPLVPVTPPPRAVIEDLGIWIDPLGALAEFRGCRHPVLLLSGLTGHPASRFSILGCDPTLTVSWRGGEATLTWADGSGSRSEERGHRDPFDLLRALAPAGAMQRNVSGLPFAGGAIGYLGYGLRRSIESLP